jgi:hypothetical protein
MRPQTLSPFEKGIQTKALGKLYADSITVSNRIDCLIGTWPNSYFSWVMFKSWRLRVIASYAAHLINYNIMIPRYQDVKTLIYKDIKKKKNDIHRNAPDG